MENSSEPSNLESLKDPRKVIDLIDTWYQIDCQGELPEGVFADRFIEWARQLKDMRAAFDPEIKPFLEYFGKRADVYLEILDRLDQEKNLLDQRKIGSDDLSKYIRNLDLKKPSVFEIEFHRDGTKAYANDMAGNVELARVLGMDKEPEIKKLLDFYESEAKKYGVDITPAEVSPNSQIRLLKGISELMSLVSSKSEQEVLNDSETLKQIDQKLPGWISFLARENVVVAAELFAFLYPGLRLRELPEVLGMLPDPIKDKFLQEYIKLQKAESVNQNRSPGVSIGGIRNFDNKTVTEWLMSLPKLKPEIPIAKPPNPNVWYQDEPTKASSSDPDAQFQEGWGRGLPVIGNKVEHSDQKFKPGILAKKAVLR